MTKFNPRNYSRLITKRQMSKSLPKASDGEIHQGKKYKCLGNIMNFHLDKSLRITRCERNTFLCNKHGVSHKSDVSHNSFVVISVLACSL